MVNNISRFMIIPMMLVAIFALLACSSDVAVEEPAPAAAQPTAGSETTAEATATPESPAAMQSSAQQQSTPSTSAPSGTPTSIPVQTAPPTASPAISAASTERDSDKPVGGVMRRLFSDPPTLDPHKTSDTTSAFIVGEVYSGLVTLNTDLQIVPDIAERWEISDDGMVYTFHLLPDAKFADGKPVTAQDFVYSLNRAADPELASPVARTYLSDIVGVTEVLDGEATEITGVKAIDERTLEITIDAPIAYFLAKLTYPTAFVVDKANVEAGGDNWTDAPNSTGPFTLKEYRIGEHIILERNDNFYREPAYIDQAVFNLAGGQAMALYENDEIDITGVGLFDLERLSDPNEPLNAELKVAPPGFSVSYIGFNVDNPPFDDLHFRRALNYAIDKELIANEVLSGLTVPAYGILPPGFPGYTDDIEGLTYDLERAVDEICASAYANAARCDEASASGDFQLGEGESFYADDGPRIVLSVSGTGGDIGIDMQVILEMWKTGLGVEVEIQQSEWATYLQDLNRRNFQIYALGWQADYPDPQDFLDILFHTESETNHGAYSNATVDAMLEEARVERDSARRVELYNQVEQMIIDDAAWVPLWYRSERNLLLKPHIKDYRLVPMTIPKLRYVYFDYDN
ncbi:MAG: ABC transporter substrate-binding protein [Chloroflexi bacterium]|nr:ABC transporter substrate-binding protein [Chloroflexota bacterium]